MRTTVPRASGGGVRAWLATLSLLADAFTGLALTAPPNNARIAAAVATAAAGGAILSLAILVRGARLAPIPGAVVTLVSLAASTTAAGLSLDPPGGSAASPQIGRTGWLLILAGLVLPGIAIRHLMAVLRSRAADVARMSRTDQLTGVPNREAWDDELRREMARAQRHGTPLTIAVLDIDRLEAFNGLRGHAEGDQLLRNSALAWNAALRGTDLIARLESGRFGVLFHRCALENAVPIVERLRIGVPEAQTASAGIAMWDRSEAAPDLVSRAMAALEVAKSRGRDRVSVSTRPEYVDRTVTDDWSAAVKDLVDHGQMVSAYQPIVDLSNGRVVAYEALARPDSQVVDMSVERLFSTAQRIGLARELDWLCRRAALADTSWMPEATSLFINCNAGFLVDPVHRADQMLLVLEAVGLKPQQVVLEITERELAGDLGRLRSVVETYRCEGFRFAIDDVGEGHSTLEVLAAVRPEFVKVARSLVVEVGSVGARAAIRAVVAFARESGARVIAEGIEVPSTARQMRDLGVDLAQGYLFGKPAFPIVAA